MSVLKVDAVGASKDCATVVLALLQPWSNFSHLLFFGRKNATGVLLICRPTMMELPIFKSTLLALSFIQ